MCVLYPSWSLMVLCRLMKEEDMFFAVFSAVHAVTEDCWTLHRDSLQILLQLWSKALKTDIRSWKKRKTLSWMSSARKKSSLRRPSTRDLSSWTRWKKRWQKKEQRLCPEKMHSNYMIPMDSRSILPKRSWKKKAWISTKRDLKPQWKFSVRLQEKRVRQRTTWEQMQPYTNPSIRL